MPRFRPPTRSQAGPEPHRPIGSTGPTGTQPRCPRRPTRCRRYHCARCDGDSWRASSCEQVPISATRGLPGRGAGDRRRLLLDQYRPAVRWHQWHGYADHRERRGGEQRRSQRLHRLHHWFPGYSNSDGSRLDLEHLTHGPQWWAPRRWVYLSSRLSSGPGTGSLTVANGGTVNVIGGAQTVFVAEPAGSTGTVNIGAASVAAAVAPGFINAANVLFGAGAASLNFNHTATDYVFAPVIGGNGAVNVISGRTILTASNTYTGPTTVNGGALIVDGSIASSSLTTVNGGGLLGGSGTVGSPSINQLAARSRQARQTRRARWRLPGNLAFQSGALYSCRSIPRPPRPPM